MEEKVKEFIKIKNMISNGDKIVVGVSGGADSMALLHFFCSVKETYNLEVFVAHINHSTRNGQSDDDEKFVLSECEKLNVECFTKKIDIKKEALLKKRSEEEIGRYFRYIFFNEVLEKVGANKIATAHQLNDNVETFLLNLSRGAGLSGLLGIKPKANNIIRPFLCVTRDEILKYVNDNKICFHEDYTNLESIYTRNKFRNNVVSYIKNNINPNFENSVNNTIKLLDQDNSYIDKKVDEALKYIQYNYDSNSSSLKTKIDDLIDLDISILTRIIRKFIFIVSKNLLDISSVHIDIIIKLLNKGLCKTIDINENLIVKTYYGEVEFVNPKFEKEKKEVYIEICDIETTKEIVIYDKKIKFTLLDNNETVMNEIIKNNNNTYIKYFNYDNIVGNILVRNKRDGDRISIFPTGVTKKIKEILIEMKIPKNDRENTLIISDAKNILWVIGIRYGEIFRVLPKTKKVLKIELT